MRLLSVVLLATSSIFAATPTPNPRVPVLVELFTSEGCSSCPPADALLAELEREQPVAGAEILALGEHVDYWDGLGWRDRFSSRDATQRQNSYSSRFGLDSIYTPQMVVDGRAQFVGNDRGSARRAITAATASAKLPLLLNVGKIAGRELTATVSLGQRASGVEGDVMAALVDLVDTTEVRRGENGGRTLHHVSVVRTLTRVGRLSELNKSPLTFTVSAPKEAAAGAMRLVVFVQGAAQGPVLGAVASSAAQVASATVNP
jgi:hypothetical protein